MVAYVHIEYSTDQFSGEPKKRGPERVKSALITKCVSIFNIDWAFI